MVSVPIIITVYEHMVQAGQRITNILTLVVCHHK